MNPTQDENQGLPHEPSADGPPRKHADQSLDDGVGDHPSEQAERAKQDEQVEPNDPCESQVIPQDMLYTPVGEAHDFVVEVMADYPYPRRTDSPTTQDDASTDAAGQGMSSVHAAHGFTANDARHGTDAIKTRARRPVHTDPFLLLLIMGWCIYLLLGWVVPEITDGSGEGRWVFLTMMMGMTVLWPALRLSVDGPQIRQTTRRRTVRYRDVLVDWISLNLLNQVVLWAFYYHFRKPMELIVVMHLAVAGWSLLSAGIVAWGVRSRDGRARATAMLLCVLLVLGEPVAMVIANVFGGYFHLLNQGQTLAWSMRVSPLEVIWSLTQPGRATDFTGALPTIASVWAGGVIAWILLVVLRRRATHHHHKNNPPHVNNETAGTQGAATDPADDLAGA